MPSPNELRSFAKLARIAANELRRDAETYPVHRADLMRQAEVREDDARFYEAKADRDEAWFETEDYLELEAAE